MLQFEGSWRFDSPGTVSSGVVDDLLELIARIATQGDAQSIYEAFKSNFATAAGESCSWSSNLGWAQTDLDFYMRRAAENAPLFIEAFYECGEFLRKKGISVPDVDLINRILSKHDARYEIRPPYLILHGAQTQPTRASFVAPRPLGNVPPKLDWSTITDEEFERLVYCLIADTTGYENAQWLQQTHASDRGRDLSVTRIDHDPLGGVRRHRVIIQCKHWLSRSVGPRDVSDIRSQMELWQPPRVDVLIIATTGRFTADAIALIENHNQADRALHIGMWPDSHLEMLLATRPHLIAEFRLRKTS